MPSEERKKDGDEHSKLLAKQHRHKTLASSYTFSGAKRKKNSYQAKSRSDGVQRLQEREGRGG